MANFIRKWILETQLWVSVMVSCLCLFFGLLYQGINYKRVFLVFFSTLSAYNFIYLHASGNRMPYRKISLGLFFIGMLGWVCILLEERDLYLSANLLFLSFIVFMYNSGSLVIRIRNIFLLKIFVISFVWAYSVLWIGNSIVPVSIPGFISVFLFIVGITIPFDICDMGRDSIQTIPKLLGIKKSKYFACFFLLSSAVLFYLNFPEKTDFVVSWSLACGVSVALVLFMKSKDSYFYTRFWIEACSSFPFILLYLLQKIRAIL